MFAKRVKQLRNEKGISQAELAKIINSSTSKVSMWEVGKRDPNSEDLITLSKYFNVSVDYLLGASDIKNPYEKKKEDIKKEAKGLKKDPFDAFETFAAHQNEGGIKNEEDLANMVEDIVKKILEEKEKED